MKILSILVALSMIAMISASTWTYEACDCSDFGQDSCPQGTCWYNTDTQACVKPSTSDQCKAVFEKQNLCNAPYCRQTNSSQCVLFSNCESLAVNQTTVDATFCSNYFCGFDATNKTCYTPTECSTLSNVQCTGFKFLNNWGNAVIGTNGSSNETNLPNAFNFHSCYLTNTTNGTCVNYEGCEALDTVNCEVSGFGLCKVVSEKCVMKECTDLTVKDKCNTFSECNWVSNTTNSTTNETTYSCQPTVCNSFNSSTDCPQSMGINGYCGWNGQSCKQCKDELSGNFMTAFFTVLAFVAALI